MQWLVISLLSLWFAATVAYQIWFPRLLPLVRRFDYFRVLPGWRLFPSVAPELRLYYRDRDTSGSLGEWIEIPMRRSQRPWRAFWNPDLIYPDAQLSFMEFLVAIVRSISRPIPDRVRSSVPWQAVWLVSSDQPRPAQSVARQFEVREYPLAGHAMSESAAYTSAFEPLAH